MTEISDALWAPLREAVPSFDAQWQDYVARPSYNAVDAGVNIFQFTDHLTRLVAKNGPRAATTLLTAMEACYAWVDSRPADAGAAELERLMSITILERLIHATEDGGHDLAAFVRLLPGPLTRSAWERAVGWTHPECSWDWERGLVFLQPPPRSVARFRVSGNFFLSARNAVIVHGEVIEGRIVPGNVLRLRLSAGFHIEGRIAAVELLRTATGEEVGLILPLAANSDPVTEETMWSGLEGEILEVADIEGSPGRPA